MAVQLKGGTDAGQEINGRLCCLGTATGRMRSAILRRRHGTLSTFLAADLCWLPDEQPSAEELACDDFLMQG